MSKVERDSQTQTRGYVSRFEPLALCSRLHRVKDFHYFHKETPRRIQNSILYTRGGTKQITSTQEGGHKAKAQSKENGLQHLVITKITNQNLTQLRIL